MSIDRAIVYAPHDPGPEDDGGPLTVEVDRVDVSHMGYRSLDPTWTHTDEAGHFHYVDQAGTPKQNLKTLKWVVDGATWCEQCEEPHEHGHHECPICGETIEPGLKNFPAEHKTVPGRRSYKLGDRYVTVEEAREWLEAQGLDATGVE